MREHWQQKITTYPNKGLLDDEMTKSKMNQVYFQNVCDQFFTISQI